MSKKLVLAVVIAAAWSSSGTATAHNAIADVPTAVPIRMTAEPFTQLGHLFLADTNDIGACSRYKRFRGDFLNCSYTTENECTGSATVKAEWIRNGSCSG